MAERQRKYPEAPPPFPASLSLACVTWTSWVFFLRLLILGCFCFCPTHPHPQFCLFSAIFITSFSVGCCTCFSFESVNPTIKYFSNHLNLFEQKNMLICFWNPALAIRCFTLLSSIPLFRFYNFLRASKLESAIFFSLKLPMPQAPTGADLSQQFTAIVQCLLIDGVRYPITIAFASDQPDLPSIFLNAVRRLPV